MEAKIPEDKLMKIGFRLLDLMYGELTIRKGKYWNEVFVDKHDIGRLGCDKPESKKQSLLAYLYEDGDEFLRMIPVEESDYVRVLKAWVLERYKRRVDSTIPRVSLTLAPVLERYKHRVDTTQH